MGIFGESYLILVPEGFIKHSPRLVPVGDNKFCPRPIPGLRRKSGTKLEIPRGQFAIPAPSPSPNYGAGTGIPAGRVLKSPPYLP